MAGHRIPAMTANTIVRFMRTSAQMVLVRPKGEILSGRLWSVALRVGPSV